MNTMYNLVVKNITANDSTTLQKLLAEQGIESEIVPVKGTISIPTLEASSRKQVSTPVKEDKEDKVSELVDDKKYTIGDYVVVYPTLNAVRHWNPDKFTPKNVMFALKQSLKEAGASWSKELNAYQFTTKKAFNAWVKAQKDRETK